MSQEKNKILIVDDKHEDRTILETLLSTLDVEVIEAASGLEALRLISKHHFCLAIIDVQMPQMSGYELVELLRDNIRTADLPIILMSAVYQHENHHYKAYKSGAVDLINKPFNSQLLLAKVKVFLDLYYHKQELETLVNLFNQANTKLLIHTAQLKAISHVVQQVTSELDLNNLLTTTANAIQTEFKYYFVGLWVANKTKNALVLRASASYQGPTLLKQGTAIPLKKEEKDQNSIINTVYQSDKYYLSNNVLADTAYQALAELPDTRSEFALPLYSGSEPIGVLDIQSDVVNAFSQEDTVVMQILANQIAIAIHNAQFYQVEQEQRQILAKLNADKDLFFSIVAHDLRSPFTPLLGNAKLLARLANKLQLTEVEEISHSIYRSANNIYALLENLLQWGRMQMGHIKCEPETLDLTLLLNQNIELFTENALKKGIKLQNRVKQSVYIHADQYMISIIIRNLLSNALKFTASGGQITTVAQLSTDGKFVEVQVIDTGVGISKKAIKKLFTIGQHHSTFGTNQEQGTGLGLTMCQDMIDLNGGNLWIESELEKGTTVKFTVPMADLSQADIVQNPIILADLEGTAQLKTDANKTDTDMLLPLESELLTLLDLAITGNMKKIMQLLARLEKQNKLLKPFVNQVSRLVEQFEDESLVMLLNEYLFDLSAD